MSTENTVESRVHEMAFRAMTLEREALEMYMSESDGITVGIPVELAYAILNLLIMSVVTEPVHDATHLSLNYEADPFCECVNCANGMGACQTATNQDAKAQPVQPSDQTDPMSQQYTAVALEVVRAEIERLREALETIAYAGMSPSYEMSVEGILGWHANQAWKFIGIAARALTPTPGAEQ